MKTSEEEKKPYYTFKNKDEFEFSKEMQAIMDKILNNQDRKQELHLIDQFIQKGVDRYQELCLYFNQQNKSVEMFAPSYTKLTFSFFNKRPLFAYRFSNFHKSVDNFQVGLCKNIFEKSFVTFACVDKKFENDELRVGYEYEFNKQIQKLYYENSKNIYASYSIPNKWFYPSSDEMIKFIIEYKSRENFLYPDSELQKKIKKSDHLYQAASPFHQSLLKQSDLLKVTLQMKTLNNIRLSCSLAADFYNKSYWARLGLSYEHVYQITPDLQITNLVDVWELSGKNLFKNDLLFIGNNPEDRNHKAVLRHKMELAFKKFPFISTYKIHPYLYFEHFLSLKRNPLGQSGLGQIDGKAVGEFGIGMKNQGKSVYIDWSLLKFNKERKNGISSSISLGF